MKKLSVEYLDVGDLLPYARNSRTHSEEQVAQIAGSIKEFGFTNPVLIDADGGIIAGHGRVMAARKLGLQQVPTIALLGLTEAQKRAYIIADNRLPLNAGWDADMLQVELSDLSAQGFDLDLLGFTADELADLLPDPEAGAAAGADPDEIPEPPENPISSAGEVWLLGKHRLMCGDSTSTDHLAQLTQGNLVDMWLTDPPYNVAVIGGSRADSPNERKKKGGKEIENDSMDDAEFRQFLRDSYSAADAVMKPGAVFYIWHANKESYNFQGAALDIGWAIRQHLVWKKSSLVMGQQDYHYKHEPCLYGWKDGAGHLWAADRKQTTVLEFDRPARNAEHPTMKPVALFEYQMLNNTKGGDLVLDSFGGSGTTLIAAEKNGRTALLMELDPRYCDVIVKRWQDFTGKQATLEGDGRTFAEVEAERLME